MLIALAVSGCATWFSSPVADDCMDYVGVELKAVCGAERGQFQADVVNSHPKRGITVILDTRAATAAPEAEQTVEVPAAATQAVDCLAAARVKSCKFKP